MTHPSSSSTNEQTPLADLPPEQRRQRIAEAYQHEPSQMTMVLASKLGVPEVEVVRALPAERVVELDISQWESILRAFEQLENVHVISSNGSVTLECFGAFGNFSTWGDFFNVQTKSLDMHIRYKALAAAFAVVKPGHLDGVQTLSFQFFDHRGASAFKVFLTFGQRVPSAERRAAFEAIRDRFALPTTA